MKEQTPTGSLCISSRYQRPGVVAAYRDTAKIAKYWRREDASYTFVPMSIESYGRLGAPLMDLI
jgi:hypothetical protein